MPESPRTVGERIFEKYLNTRTIPFEFEKEHPGKSNRPDYTIEWEGRPVVFDVKDFDAPNGPPKRSGGFDPYPPIREKIDQGRDKFKQFKEYCCGLVLFKGMWGQTGRSPVFLSVQRREVTGGTSRLSPHFPCPRIFPPRIFPWGASRLSPGFFPARRVGARKEVAGFRELAINLSIALIDPATVSGRSAVKWEHVRACTDVSDCRCALGRRA
jgi:hypothetical protein